jgi:hypothetical protein
MTPEEQAMERAQINEDEGRKNNAQRPSSSDAENIFNL